MHKIIKTSLNKTINRTHITAFIYGISPFMWILYGFGPILILVVIKIIFVISPLQQTKNNFFLLENAFNHQVGTLYYNIRDTYIIGGALADAPDQGRVN